MTPKLNLLMSWQYLKGVRIRLVAKHASEINLFLDCGAIAAYAKGGAQDVEAYCDFVEALPLKPWGYLAMDEIGNPEVTRRNFERMLARGLRPIPIHTRNQPIENLDYYFDHSDLVAIGGLATGATGGPEYMARVMAHAKGRHVHLLGMTKLWALRQHAPYSTDSASWESAARYGSIGLYMGHGRYKQLRRRQLLKRPSDDVVAAIRRLGCNPFDLQKEAAWHGGPSVIRFLSASSWIALANDVKKYLGTQVFLATTNEVSVGVLLQAHRYHQGTGGNILCSRDTSGATPSWRPSDATSG